VEIRGSVVVVTGASSGFGELTALRFGRAGARVVLAARRLERLEALAERIASEGGSALTVRCDVTELAQLTAPAPGSGDPALREEVRQLVIARNERRAGRGQPPLDVEAEVDRQLRDLAG